MKAFAAFALLLALASGQEKRSVQVKAGDVEWTPVSLPGVPAGIQQKLPHNNTASKVQSAIVRFPKGFREPRHYHHLRPPHLYFERTHPLARGSAHARHLHLRGCE